MAPKTVNKSAVTGKFVTKQEVQKHPKTTFVETTKPAPTKKGK